MGYELPPLDPYSAVSFMELMKLETINDRTFRSATRAFQPGGKLHTSRTFGGHVYAQAVLAAARTVKQGFLVHVCKCFAHGAEDGLMRADTLLERHWLLHTARSTRAALRLPRPKDPRWQRLCGA